MKMIYKPLSYSELKPGTVLHRPDHKQPGNVSPNDPAITVMTDLSSVNPITIDPTLSIQAANDKMIAFGVRLLFVTNGEAVVGIITAYDILGEKPVKHLQEHGGTHAEILVRDIMTPQEQLEVLHLSRVRDANVGDIVETMRSSRRLHALVVERQAGEPDSIRGLFSTTQIGRQLGITVEPSNRANTFAELEEVLVSAA